MWKLSSGNSWKYVVICSVRWREKNSIAKRWAKTGSRIVGMLRLIRTPKKFSWGWERMNAASSD
jgi:hypothetical protein